MFRLECASASEALRELSVKKMSTNALWDPNTTGVSLIRSASINLDGNTAHSNAMLTTLPLHYMAFVKFQALLPMLRRVYELFKP